MSIKLGRSPEVVSHHPEQVDKKGCTFSEFVASRTNNVKNSPSILRTKKSFYMSNSALIYMAELGLC